MRRVECWALRVSWQITLELIEIEWRMEEIVLESDKLKQKINTKIADIIRELESFSFPVKFEIVSTGFNEVGKGTFGGVKFNIEGTSAGKNDVNILREAKTSGGKKSMIVNIKGEPNKDMGDVTAKTRVT